MLTLKLLMTQGLKLISIRNLGIFPEIIMKDLVVLKPYNIVIMTSE